MPSLISSRTAALATATAALAVAVTAALSAAAPALAAPQPTVQTSFVDVLPCQNDPGLFKITLYTRDRLHELTADSRYHENSSSIGTFTAAPVTQNESTGTVGPRAGASWTGRVVLTHTANDGTAGAGHAVSTFNLRISGVSDTGQRAAQQQLGHYTGTVRPDQLGAVVRQAFSRSTCR